MTDTRDSYSKELANIIESLRNYAQDFCDSGDDKIALNEYADRLTALQSGAGDGVEEYQVWVDDMMVAGAEGEGSLKEALHYAKQYEQDGPVTIYKVTRQVIATQGHDMGVV